LRIRPRKSSLIAAEVADVIRARKIPVRSMFVDRGSLDEVFRKITVDDKAEEKGDA
jgi:ABC-2 type transport system ATP-binding protein